MLSRFYAPKVPGPMAADNADRPCITPKFLGMLLRITTSETCAFITLPFHRHLL